MPNAINEKFRKNHAFLIGIDQYDELACLQTAVNDVEELERVLKGPFHDFQVHPLLLDATFDKLIHLLTVEMPAEVEKEDRVLLYFAGHGIAFDDEGQLPRGFVLPKDARRDDESKSLSMEELYSYLNKLECRHFLLILDCCFSGAFRWQGFEKRGIQLPRKIYRSRFERYTKDPAWQVLTSSSYDQQALDVIHNRAVGRRQELKNDHSPFAQLLYEALQGEADLVPQGNPNGLITATEIYLFIRDKLEEKTSSIGETHRQTPSFFPLARHDKGEFLFLSPKSPLNLPDFDPDVRPFKGLNSYETADAELFFGRERAVNEILERLEDTQFLVVSGVSGIGKSSLIKAGVLPVFAGDGYNCLSIRPGAKPLQNIKDIPIHGNEKRILFIDQYEELKTQCQEESQREGFINELQSWLDGSLPENRIIISIRADFEPLLKDSFPVQDWQDHRYVVPPFTQDELREVIQRPLNARAMYIDPPELAEEIINSVVQHPGALPLLSFLLNEMFELWRRERQQYEDRTLNWEDYRRLGGVVGALQSKANALFDGSELHLQDALKIAMLRMVAFEAGNVTGRRVLESELDFGNIGRNKDISTALDLLTEARLIVRGRDVNEEAFIEPAHDALVNGWGYLWDWIEEYGKENIMLLHQLNAPAVAYQKMRREDGSKEPGNVFTQETPLWKIDPRLPAVFEFYKKHTYLLNKREAVFLEASNKSRIDLIQQYKRDRDEAERRLQVSEANELALRAKIMSGTNATKALRLAEAAFKKKDTASTRSILSEIFYKNYFYRQPEATKSMRTGLNASLADIACTPDGRAIVFSSANQAVILQEDFAMGDIFDLAGPGDNIRCVTVSPDYTTAAIGTQGGSVLTWDITVPSQPPVSVANLGQEICSLSFHYSNRLLSATGAFGVKIWDFEKRSFLSLQLPNPEAIEDEVVAAFNTLAYLADHLLIYAYGQVMVFDVNTEDFFTLREKGFSAYSLAFIGMDAFLSAPQGEIQRWEFHYDYSFHRRNYSTYGGWPVIKASPDGKRVAMANGNTITMADLTLDRVKNAEPIVLNGHSNRIQDIVFTPDGRHLISIDESNFYIWDLSIHYSEVHVENYPEVEKKRPIAVCPEKDCFVSVLKERKDGKDFNGLHFQQLSTGKTIKLLGPLNRISGLAFHKDGRYLAATMADSGLMVLNLEKNETRFSFPEGQYGKLLSNNFTSVVFSDDPGLLAVGSDYGDIALIRLGQNPLDFKIKSKNIGYAITDIKFSPDRQQIAIATEDILFHWNLKTNKLMELGTYMFLRSVEISQDGKWMIAGSGYSKKDRSQIHIWNLKSKKLHYSLENFKPDQSINVDVTKVFIAEDSKHLVVYDTYSIKLWDLETKDLLKTIPLPDRHMENPAICQTRNGDIKVLLHDYTHKTDTVIYTSRFPISALEKDSLNKFSGEELGL